MNLPKASASKAQQGTPANSQVRKTWLVLSSPRSHDGEIHAIRHPSADLTLSSVTVPTRPSGKTLALNAQPYRPHRKRVRLNSSLCSATDYLIAERWLSRI
jgi:hypothetical protein